MARIDRVRKRDGRVVPFDQERITDAIFKAARAVGGHDRAKSEELSNEVVRQLERKFADIPAIEDIQDMVEKVLIEKGKAKTAKAYILYRRQHSEIRDVFSLLSSYELVENYMGKSDWRVKENANMSYSLQGLNFHISSAVVSNYWLNKIYPPEIGDAHREAEFHVHDLGILGAYCVGWDLKDLLLNGFGHVSGKIASSPPKHFRTALGQVVNFFYTLQGEAAGAQAFSNFDTYLCPFIRYDNLDYKQVKQALQEFIFNINVPTRVGFQTPFTNVTMDLTIPPMLANDPVIACGKLQDDVYGDFQREMDLFNKAFCEVMMDGDANGRVFTFPIPTYNITKDFDWDGAVVEDVFKMTAKYGVPYFSNFVNSDMKPEDARSMCIHAKEELVFKKDGRIGRGCVKDFVESNCYEFDGEGWAEPSSTVEVASLDPETMEMEWKPVRRFLRVKDSKSVNIKTRDGKSFVASENHVVTVLAPEGLKNKAAKDVETGDYLFSLKDGSALLNAGYDQLAGRTLDEELAFLLGFFTADGNFLWKPGMVGVKARGVQFSFNAREPALIARIRELVKKVWGVEAKEKKDPRYNTVYLYVYRSGIADALWKEGFRKHGRLPAKVYNSPKPVIEAFLGGFFEGDGYEKRKEIHINDLELARDLAVLYGLVGVPVIFKRRKDSQVIYLQNRKTEVNAAGLVTTPCLYERVPGFLAKSTYIVPGLNKGRMVGTATLQKYAAHTLESRKIAEGSVYPVRVTSVARVEHEQEQEFYDVELGENHLFMHSLGTVTHNCCRLRLDNRELRKRGGGLFGANPLTGSVGVVTLNMPRVGYLAKNEAEYFERLDALMDLAQKSLEIKREVLERFTEQGLYPYSRYYLRDVKQQFGQYWKNHFGTIGLIGLNESVVNLLHKSIADPEGKAFAVKVLKHMRDRLAEYQAKTGNIYNLEATPGEGTSFRLARTDKKAYPDIIAANEDAYKQRKAAPFYTNSSHLPVGHTQDIFEALEHQDDLQTLYTGGTVLHGFVGEEISDWRTARELVRKIANSFRLPYFTLTPTFSVCPKHGYLAGKHEYCPKCDEEIGFVSELQKAAATGGM